MRLPQRLPDCPEQRAGDRGQVEVGEVVVRDLQRGRVVEGTGEDT